MRSSFFRMSANLISGPIFPVQSGTPMRQPIHLLLLVTVLALLAGCREEQGEKELGDGIAPPVSGPAIETWRLEIQLPHAVLPVQLQMAKDYSSAWFVNGAERVAVPEVSRSRNLLTLRFPSFNNTLTLDVGQAHPKGELVLVKRGYEQRMPVKAARNVEYRFSPDPEAATDVTGRWDVVFADDEGVETHAVGELDQQGSRLTGTFLTPTGDHRYLEGEVDGKTLRLSVFDGAHAYVFVAEQVNEGQLSGDWWSGTRWHESWKANRNFDARLPDPYSLTFLKPGYDSLAFTFPDLGGNPVSLSDEKYRGKVVLVTLSGTWCPNCADEVAFLSPYYRSQRERGLEIITLLYEHFEDFDRAAAQGRALKEQYGILYDLLVAGVSDKTLAAETLPMLNRVLAFPTTIFVDRKGRVRKIHTGFSGPATGAHYTEFVAGFEATMEELLSEQP